MASFYGIGKKAGSAEYSKQSNPPEYENKQAEMKRRKGEGVGVRSRPLELHGVLLQCEVVVHVQVDGVLDDLGVLWPEFFDPRSVVVLGVALSLFRGRLRQ